MALRTPPSWLQNGSHPAENDRMSVAGQWRSSGVLSSADLQVTQSTVPAMSVSIAAGWGVILGTYQANMGAYQFTNDAATTATINTADPTNPRIDLICITVSDAFYTGVTNTVTFNVVAGTPAGSPAAPATPTNSIVLAQVAVAALAATIVNANITDKRAHAGTVTGFIPSSIAASTALLDHYAYYVTTSSPWTLTLPAAPIINDEIRIFDASGSAATNNITVSPNGLNLQGSVQNLVLAYAYVSVTLIYTGATYGWKVA